MTPASDPQPEPGVSFSEVALGHVRYLWVWAKMILVGILVICIPIVALYIASTSSVIASSTADSLAVLWFLLCLLLIPAYKRAKLSQT